MKNSLLIFGTKNFNNSLNEIKDFLNFPLFFYDKHTFSEHSLKLINSVLVDVEACSDLDILDSINKIKNKPILLFKKQNSSTPINLSAHDTVILPQSLFEISNMITNLIITKKFKQNSSIEVKGYEVDKNERKLKKKIFQLLLQKEKYNL